MLHIPAKYQTRNLYGYGNFPPDTYVKKWNFGIQNGRQDLDPINPIFLVQMGPIGIHPQTKFGLASLSHYENFPLKRFRLRQRRTQSECNSPLVLRTKWAKKGTSNYVREMT